MLHRNAARHLLLAVSILLFVFIYVGYTLRKRSDSVGLDVSAAMNDATSSVASGTGMPSADGKGALRTGPEGLAPDAEELAGWIPSVSDEEITMPSVLSPAAGSVALPQGSTSSPSGEIMGLIPATPSDSASQSSIRPPASISGADTASSGGDLSLPSELVDSAAGGQALSGDNTFLASLSVPGGNGTGGDASPHSASGLTTPPSSTMRPQASAMPEAASSGVSLPVPPMENGFVPGGGNIRTTPPGIAAPVSPARPGGGRLAPPVNDAPSQAVYDENGYDDDEWESGASTGVGANVSGNDEMPPVAVRPGIRTPPPGATRPVRRPQPLSEQPRSESLRIYVVRAGDTLTSIASRELGAPSLADNIFLLNRDVIDDPDHLLAGVKIRLPYATPPEFGADGRPLPTRRPTQGLGRTHVVVRGDTLSSIAQQYYGSSAGWRFLYESNKHLLPNPNQLSVGMELSVPPYEQ